MVQVIQSILPSSSQLWIISFVQEWSWHRMESFCSPKMNEYIGIIPPTIDFRSTCIPSSRILCPSSMEEVTQDYMQQQLGKDWMEYPVVFRGIWSREELSSPQRRLSISGLQQDEELSNVRVNYFTTASALKPNSEKYETVGTVIREILSSEKPLKLASQIPLQQIPSLITEVAPKQLVETLFGRHRFDPNSLRPKKLFFGLLNIPASTTVPIFVASSFQNARTDLHAEPIGNFAVQLHGSKQWTLALPSKTSCLRPSISDHGRAYYYSHLSSDDIQSSTSNKSFLTEAGDAVWIPPWTWHRVDYTILHTTNNKNSSISMAASLFHFRFFDFWYNHPLLAMLILPNIIREAMGANIE